MIHNPTMQSEMVVEALKKGALHTVNEARVVGAVPAHPGVYAWWVRRDTLSELRVTEHPDKPFELLYVGIAPRSPSSSASLRSRLCRQHISGNVNSSTFRFGLAALLWTQEGWQPRRSASGKVRLTVSDNQALSEWQRRNLRVSWTEVDKPWLHEADVIAALQPPMNRERNQSHPLYAVMGNARKVFRAAAIPL
jgi:hypothetical protein